MKLLLTGNPGVGKTTICRLVAEQLGEQPLITNITGTS
jgi:nucleoside-triphosphatase THEP1